MHILHLIKTSEGANWAINLMKDVKERYPEITFSVIIPTGGRQINKYFDVCEKVYYFDYKLNFSLFKRGIEFRKIVLEDKPTLIHSWFAQTTLYARLFLRDLKTPRLFQVVGPLHLENTIFKYLDIFSAQRNDYWIATSKYIFNKYKSSNINDDKLFLNYAYIDIDNLLKTAETTTRNDFRKKYDIPDTSKIIGTASYMYPPKFYEKTGVKGHEFLLEAFKQLIKKRTDVVLLVAGTSFGSDSSYEEKLIEKANEISPDKIFFTGKYNHIYEVISSFDVFVYLSTSENLGGVYESLLFEIPTISSDRGGLPELVINNETGFNVDPTNSCLLIDKLNTVLDNEFPNFKEKGKKIVLNTFDKNSIINTSYAIYNSCLLKNQSV